MARNARAPSGTAGMKLLSSVIINGTTSVLRDIQEEWMIAEEVPCLRFIKQHYSRYSQLPTTQSLQENGFLLPQVTEPVSYYFDKCIDRATYTLVSDIHENLITALTSKNIPEVVRVLRDVNISINSLHRDGSAAVSVLSEAQRYLQVYDENKFAVGMQGVPIGYKPLDDVTDGWLGGDLGIIVGRPALGKTNIALWMLLAGWIAGNSVLFISMEMTLQQIVNRLVAMTAKINPTFLRKGKLSFYAEDSMRAAISKFSDMSNLNLVGGNFRQTLGEVDSHILEHSPDIVFVDGGYLLGTGSSSRYTSKHEKISDVAEGLKQIAGDRNIPVVSTVQFNREVRKRSRGRMDLASIGGSDAIGQSGSVVLGITEGPKGYRTRQRTIDPMKIREGECGQFAVKFEFSPPDFSYVGGIEDRQEKSDEAAEALRRSMI